MEIKILHLIDALNQGGSERVAVNLSNEQAKRGYEVTLCTSRRGGPLQKTISHEVRYLCLKRKTRLDIFAWIRLLQYVKSHEIQIIHAHSSSIFMAASVKRFLPDVKLIWHDHYGGLASKPRNTIIYRPFRRLVDGIIAVNRDLAEWSINELGIPREKVRYVPNFVLNTKQGVIVNLPGQKGFRIVCVAHLRPQKDHITLIHAFKIIMETEPRAHLILVGKDYFPEVANRIWAEISNLNLGDHITWLGSRDDTQDIIENCDIGVLSSKSEGLPLSLLEYGLARLPVVSTNVGECATVLKNGEFGYLVPPESPSDLASKILSLLRNPNDQVYFGTKFNTQIRRLYGVDTILPRIEAIYQKILGMT